MPQIPVPCPAGTNQAHIGMRIPLQLGTIVQRLPNGRFSVPTQQLPPPQATTQHPAPLPHLCPAATAPAPLPHLRPVATAPAPLPHLRPVAPPAPAPLLHLRPVAPGPAPELNIIALTDGNFAVQSQTHPLQWYNVYQNGKCNCPAGQQDLSCKHLTGVIAKHNLSPGGVAAAEKKAAP